MNTLFHFLHMVAGAAFTSILVAGVFVAQVLAQTTNHSSTDKMTPPALNPGAPSGSYSISGFDNVNLFNGHLNFHLPLLNVKGRGEAQAQMTLAIEQLWRVRRNVGYMGGDFVDEHYPESKWWTGLKPGYGPGVLQGRVTALQVDECTSLPGVTYPAQMVTRLYFTAPDGSEHEFRDTVYDGRPLNYGPCAAIGNSRGKVFVTNDGSSMTFISNADIKDDSWNTAAIDGLFFPSGYLLMKDGTRYKVEGGYVKAIIDRNGNQLTFAYDNNSSVFEQYDRVIAITDSLNRQVTIEYDVQEGGEYGLCDRITYKGFGGADRVIRVSKKSLGGALRSPDVLPRTLEALFPELEGCNTCYFNPTVVSAVWLPGDRSYKFSYNPYGELAAVQLPTGGVYEYDYGPGVEGDAASGVTLGYDGGATGPSKQIYRRVVEKRIYTSGGVLEGKVRFGPQESWSGGLYTNAGFVSVDRLDGNNVRQARSDHYFYGRASGAGERTDTGYTSWKTGREYQTEYLAANGTTVLRRETRTWQQRAGVSWWAAHAQFYAASTTPDAQPSKDPRVVETVVTLPETNQVFKQTSINPQTGAVAFDQFNNRTDVWEYDFGTDAFIRRTHTDYVTTPAYVNADLNPALGASLRSLPAEQWVSTDIAGDNKVSLTTYGYDQSAPDDCPNIIGRASGYGAGFNVRGNVTSATRYGNPIARTGAVTAVAHFDIAGNGGKMASPMATIRHCKIIDLPTRI